MRGLLGSMLVMLLAISASANAATITFATDPFAGSDALTTPGRQVVGGEPTVNFDPATDIFEFDAAAFGINDILFFNGAAASLPSSGVNTIVLETFDNDANPATPFNAGAAANLIAAQLTSPTPGFFIYFNSGLNLPRLVFSTDLSDNTADLKVLARIGNLFGQSSQLVNFTASNFAIVEQVPEPASAVLLTLGLAAAAARRRRRRA